MLSDRIQEVAHWLKRVITQPRSELTRWQRTTRFAYDLGVYGAKQLKEDRAPQMAAALAYRTLFSLVPVVVVTAVTIRSLRGPEAFAEMIRAMVSAFGLNAVAVGAGEEGGTLGTWIEDLVAQAAGLNLTAIGTIGALVLVYSAIGLMVTIENSFNTVHRAPEGRSWVRRIPMYWFVLTVGPVAILLTQYLNAKLDGVLVASWAWVETVARLLWSLAVAWLAMVSLYLLVPNTRVAVRPALIGAFVSAALILIATNTMGAYMANAVSLQQIAGSLGLIPLFMFWIYVMWLIVLFGLEVAATLQLLGGRRLQEMEAKRRAATGLVDPASVIVVMEIVMRRFERGRAVGLRTIAESTDLPEPTVERIVQELIKTRYLHRVDGEHGGFALARPAGDILGSDLMRVGYRLVDGSDKSASALVARLRDAQLRLASEVTLATMTRPAQEPVAD